MRILLILLILGSGYSQAVEMVDGRPALVAVRKALEAMPVPATVQPVEGKPVFDPDTVTSAKVWIGPGEVVAAAVAIVDQGPVDGLEVMACLEGGKVHESYARLTTDNAQLIATSMMAALNLTPGVPAQEESDIPARGWPIDVRIWWRPDPDFEPNRWLNVPASALVRSRVHKKPYPCLPYIYTGSRMADIEQSVPGKGLVNTQRFMLEVTKSVMVNFDEADALLASPSPLAGQDDLFEVHSAIAPAKGSQLFFSFRRMELPVIWRADAQGQLYHGEQRLAETQQAEVVARVFPANDHSVIPVIGIVAPPEVSDERILALRLQIMALAARHNRWLVPVFLPQVPEAAELPEVK